MVRQAHHVFIIQHIQDTILSMSKDDIWIWTFEINYP